MQQFPLTQEYLAVMLGVRRASVTEAAGLLEKAELISYRRGCITIIDGQRLQELACEDYLLTRYAYEQMYRDLPPASNAARAQLENGVTG